MAFCAWAGASSPCEGRGGKAWDLWPDLLTCLPADLEERYAKVKTYPGGKFGKLMVAEMQLPGRRKNGQVLALGHSDTVWPLGTLRGS